MTTRRNRATLAFLPLAVLCGLNFSQIALAAPQETGSVDRQEVLSLLPADTEFITVAKGTIILASTKTGSDEP
jgi:hypothetical protein